MSYCHERDDDVHTILVEITRMKVLKMFFPDCEKAMLDGDFIASTI